jgi:hypothetical protein
MDLKLLQTELRKRHAYPYHWVCRQNDELDRQTRFIYNISRFQELEERIYDLTPLLKNYALNRWYNFWSAKGVQEIFSRQTGVQTERNTFHKQIDFRIHGIPFDHKTSVFPKAYPGSFDEVFLQKGKLIHWLYENQSQQSRCHYSNRLFIILHKPDGQHWRLKSELLLLSQIIQIYMSLFSVENLVRLKIGDKNVVSDIIWLSSEN